MSVLRLEVDVTLVVDVHGEGMTEAELRAAITRGGTLSEDALAEVAAAVRLGRAGTLGWAPDGNASAELGSLLSAWATNGVIVDG